MIDFKARQTKRGGLLLRAVSDAGATWLDRAIHAGHVDPYYSADMKTLDIHRSNAEKVLTAISNAGLTTELTV